MTMMPPFTPAGTTSAASSGASSTATALPKTGQQARLASAAGGTQVVAFVAFGDSTIVATAANGVPIVPGDSFVVTPPSAATHFAVIAASASATTVYVTSGIGE